MEKQKLLLFLRYFLQWIDSWSTEYTPGSGVVAGQQKFGLLEEVVFFPEREHKVEWVGIGEGLGAVEEGRRI